MGSVFGGGKGGKGGGVITPDPLQIAREQTLFNRGNQYTPFGNILFEGDNRENARIDLTADQQLAVDRALQNALGLEPPAPNDQAAEDVYGALYSRIAPDFDTRQRRLQATLDANGMPAVGADLALGAVSELDVLNRARNDATVQAAAAAQQIVPQQQMAEVQTQAAYQQILDAVAARFGGGLIPQVNAQPIDLMGGYQLLANSQAANMSNARQASADKNSTIGGIAQAAIPVVMAMMG